MAKLPPIAWHPVLDSPLPIDNSRGYCTRGECPYTMRHMQIPASGFCYGQHHTNRSTQQHRPDVPGIFRPDTAKDSPPVAGWRTLCGRYGRKPACPTTASLPTFGLLTEGKSGHSSQIRSVESLFSRAGQDSVSSKATGMPSQVLWRSARTPSRQPPCRQD
jgi:hypothetical protein